MNKDAKPSQKRRISLETAHELSASDLSELCDATEEAITSGGGFGWLKTPPRKFLKITGEVFVNSRTSSHHRQIRFCRRRLMSNCLSTKSQ